MPLTVIEVRKQYSPEQEVALIEAVQAALITAFKIPADDKCLRLIVHEPHRFACSPTRTQPEYETLVSIDVFPGRSLQAKRDLYQAIVDNLHALGIPKDHICICLREMALENWGIRGGQAASDLDLGFNLKV